MINNVRLENFNCFETQIIEFSNLTILSGLNGTGKTSVIQSLLMLRQLYTHYKFDEDRYLTEHLKSKKMLLHKNKQKQELKLTMQEERRVLSLSFVADKNTDTLKIKEVSPILLEETLDLFSIFSDKFIYLTLWSTYNRKNQEFCIQYLNTHGSEIIKNKNMLFTEIVNHSLLTTAESWLNEIIPGIEVQHSINTIDLKHRNMSSGYYFDYILAVIISLLISEKGYLIILEYPETHLHPRGQRALGKLISLAASSGSQIIIETHSEHILNGIRLSVKHKMIEHQKIIFNHFYIDNTDGFRHKIVSPKIDENGKIDIWPDGFFDEFDKEIFALI